MANIQKRGKYWRAQVRRRGWEPQSRSFDTRGEAEAWARQVESEIDRGVFVSRAEAEKTTLREALTRYEKEVTPSKRPSTIVGEKRRIARWLDDPLADRALANIRGADIAAWRDARIAEEYGANSVRLWLALLSHVFTIARKEWGMESLANPVLSVRKPSLVGTERSRRLEGNELRRLLDAAKTLEGDMDCIIEFAVETGMRRSEIANARWQHIDEDMKTVHISLSKNNMGRHVPLSTKARALLKKKRRAKDGRIFSYSADGISQAFANICDKAGIEGLWFHDLRHEATSRFFEKGLDTMEVASITGHKTLQMLRRYTHLRAHKLAKKLG